jgi:hypothetical protein
MRTNALLVWQALFAHHAFEAKLVPVVAMRRA